MNRPTCQVYTYSDGECHEECGKSAIGYVEDVDGNSFVCEEHAKEFGNEVELWITHK
jgi:hypothetical protein